MMNDLSLMSLLARLNPLSTSNPLDFKNIVLNENSEPEGMQFDPMTQQQFHPQHQASDRLRTHADSMPNRNDYRPTKTSRIGAMLAGLGTSRPSAVVGGQPVGFEANIPQSIAIRRALLDEPYNRARGDWEDKLKPLNEAAESEARTNTNNRLIDTQYMKDQNQDAEYRRRTAKDASDVQGKKDTLAQKDRYLAFKQHQQSHPNHVYKTDKDGNVYSLDPQTDEVNYPTDSDGNYIKGDKLPEEEKIKLQQENELDRISARGAESRKTGDNTSTNRLNEIGARGDETRKTNKEKPFSATRPESASQNAVRQYNKAKELLSRHPEWKDYISLDDKKKDFRIKIGSDGDPVSRQILDEVYGDQTKDINLPAESGRSKTDNDSGLQGKIRVKRKADGKTGTIDPKDFDASKYEKM
jgi:hypothetical protein